MEKIKSYLKSIFYHSNVIFSFRIVLGLTGATFIPWYFNEISAIIPITLGVMAAALTEIDVRPLKKIQYIIITLMAFTFASSTVQFLFPYPYFFEAGLILSAFAFTMLGIFGKQLSVIAFGSLLIAAYTMLAHELFADPYYLTFYLLIGASWYFLISIIEVLIQPNRTVEDAISNCFSQLAHFLEVKSLFFDPDEMHHFKSQFELAAQQNDQLVLQLNQTRFILFDHLNQHHQNKSLQKLLTYYFLLQDIHERINANYVYYEALCERFKHSDILFRFARILNLQAKECQKLSAAIEYRSPYQYDKALDDCATFLQSSLKEQVKDDVIQTLFTLLINLKHVNWLLSQANQDEVLKAQYEEKEIVGDSIHGLDEIWQRVKQNLTIKSSLFRHAIRMSLVFAIGYFIIKSTDLPHGYWIILTSLFVCQPNYSTTKHRLLLRVLGTIGGIVLGVPLLFLLPTIPAQLVLIIISGWLFFMFKNSQYAYATIFITLLVFFSFGLIGESSWEVAKWRFIATLIGCFIAFLAVNFIWPDWRFRNIPILVKKCCDDNCHYLVLIGMQYLSGKNNDVNYRLIRRKTHDDNADLASLLNIMRKEPHFDKVMQETAYRFIILNYTFISYLSTLSAHRDKTISHKTLSLFDETSVYIIEVMHSTWEDKTYKKQHQVLIEALQKVEKAKESEDRLVLQQLVFILELLPEFMAMRIKLNQ